MGFLSRSSGSPPNKDAKNTSIRSNLEQDKETDTILFNVEKCQSKELTQCRVGDYVNLWVPRDATQKVRIYRRGSVGGTGWIGYVPSNYSLFIAMHLNSGLKFETEIMEINADKSLCRIKCRLICKEETLAKQATNFKMASTNLRDELQAKYKPRNQLLVTKIQLPKNHNLVEGKELFLENKPIDYYVQDAMKLSVNFVDSNGVIVAQKSYEPKIIRSLLKAYYNKYPMKIHIKKIDIPDEYTLKYVEFIEANVEVSFGAHL